MGRRRNGGSVKGDGWRGGKRVEIILRKGRTMVVPLAVPVGNKSKLSLIGIPNDAIVKDM